MHVGSNHELKSEVDSDVGFDVRVELDGLISGYRIFNDIWNSIFMLFVLRSFEKRPTPTASRWKHR
jgi:hypothetical protein